MGRPQAHIDTEKLLEAMDAEIPQKEMAPAFGVSLPTLRARIADIKAQEGIILDTKAVENLRVIRMKEMVLNRMETSLHTMDSDELIKTLNVLNKMDKPKEEDTAVKGLIGILAAIDNEAERRSDEKVEEKLLEEKTVDITKNPLNL